MSSCLLSTATVSRSTTMHDLSFLSLPAELRIQIYNYLLPTDFHGDIIEYILHVPDEQFSTLPILTEHFGFILSCKQIYSEFEAEWCTATNKLLDSLTQGTVLHPTHVAKYSDISPLEVSVTYDPTLDGFLELKTCSSRKAMPLLAKCAHSLTLTLDNTFPPHDGTLRRFYMSPQHRLLREFEHTIATQSRIDYWDMTLLVRPTRTPCTYKRVSEGESLAWKIWEEVGYDGTLEALREFWKPLVEDGKVAMEFGAILALFY